MKALVVDDEPLIVEIWRALLEALDCEVVAAGSGLAAVDCLSRHSVDFIVTDLRMPAYDGIFLLEHLATLPVKDSIPVFVCSGFIESEADWQQKHNVTRVIRKPFSSKVEREYFRAFIADLRGY